MNYQVTRHVDPRKQKPGSRFALIKDAISSDSRSLLGGSETLCLLSFHLFSDLSAKGLIVCFYLRRVGRSLLALALAFFFR